MSRENAPEIDKELWRRFAPAGEGVPQSVSELDFAAWLDGRLPEAQAAAVEAAVAADPALRRAALELSELLGQPLPAAPPRLAARARALVGFAVERQQRRLGLFDWLLASGRRFMVQRVATLAAAVVVAISGFFLGGGLGASLAEARHGTYSESSTLSSKLPTIRRNSWAATASDMSSRMMQILLALSLLLNTFVLAGFVYRSWIVPPAFEHRPPPPPPPGQRPSPIEMVTRELDLDEAQRAKLRGVIDQHAASRRERQREIQKLRDQVAAEYRRPTIDMVRITPIIEQLGRLRVEQQKDTLRSFVEFEPQLTSQQRERMYQLLAERLAGPPWQRPPGQGAGPGPGQGRPPRQ